MSQPENRPTVRDRISVLDQAIEGLRQRAEHAAERVERAAAAAERRLARGTEAPLLEGEPTKPERLKRAPSPGVTHERPNQRAMMSRVLELLRVRPRTYAELVELTGQRHPYPAAALIQLQREGQQVVNLGSKRLAIWALAPKHK